MSADDRIVEALARHFLVSSASNPRELLGRWTCVCGAILERTPERDEAMNAHRAAVIEPIVREREAVATKLADLGWAEQVTKYADLVKRYQESIDRVQASATERIMRMRRETREREAEAWDEGRASAGISLPSNPPKQPTNPYREPRP